MDTNDVDIFVYQIDNDNEEMVRILEILIETIKYYFEVYGEEHDDFGFEITCNKLTQKQITNVMKILRRTQKKFNKINDEVCIGLNIRF
jgi:hypothetical protein